MLWDSRRGGTKYGLSIVGVLLLLGGIGLALGFTGFGAAGPSGLFADAPDGPVAQQDLGGLSDAGNLTDAETTVVGAEANATAGYDVAVGDVNGDGAQDVLVTAPAAGNVDEPGAVYLFYDPVEPTGLSVAEADVTFTGVAGDQAGLSVATGDLTDADGADVVVGAPYDDANGENTGVVYVVEGGADLPERVDLATDADAVYEGGDAEEYAGYSVATVPQRDGDGGALLVGAPFADTTDGNDAPVEGAGAAYLLEDVDVTAEGVQSLAGAASIRYVGAGADDGAGWAVADAGDVTGDGAHEVIVGAPFNDTDAGTNAGAAYVLSTDTSTDSPTDSSTDTEGVVSVDEGHVMTGVGPSDRAGYSVGTAGNVTAQEGDAVVVGAPYANATADSGGDGPGEDSGAAYVVHGVDVLEDERSLADANATLFGASVDDRAGWAVAGGEQLICDGHDDVIVGAPYADTNADSAGAAYVVAGSGLATDEDVERALTADDGELAGVGTFDRAGWAVSPANDSTGDGTHDVVVGAPYNTIDEPNAGAAYLVSGDCPVAAEGAEPTPLPATPTPTPGSEPATPTPGPDETPTPPSEPAPANPTEPEPPIPEPDSETPTPTPASTPTPESGSDSPGEGPSDDTPNEGSSDDTPNEGPSDDMSEGGPSDDTSEGGPSDDTSEGGPSDDTPDEGSSTDGSGDESADSDDDSASPSSDAPGNESSSGDDPPAQAPAEAVEFVSCDTVEISGEFDEAEVSSTMYAQDGVDTEVTEFSDLEGTTRLENLAWEGVGGYSVDAVTLLDDDPLETVFNPDRDTCVEAVQPERLSVSFVDAVETGDGDLEATFAYENSNDEALTPGASFTAGSTDDYPPFEFQPGEETFTVTWTPESGDEALELTVELGAFGYETDAVAESPPASEFTSGDANSDTDSGSEEDSDSDESNTDPADAVTFVGCDTVEIDGEFDEAEIGAFMYARDGVDTEINEFSDLEGTTRLEDLAWEGVGGYSVDSVTLFDGTEDLGTVTNPDQESCTEEIRPERISVSFVDAVETGEGDLEATFAYENPNGEALTPGASFTAGSTDDYPPFEFQPGEETFTVTWTPESGDETLELTVELGAFGYETDAVAESPPASEFTTVESSSESDESTESGTGDESDTTAETDESEPSDGEETSEESDSSAESGTSDGTAEEDDGSGGAEGDPEEDGTSDASEDSTGDEADGGNTEEAGGDDGDGSDAEDDDGTDEGDAGGDGDGDATDGGDAEASDAEEAE